nr:hypothetical protein [Bacteroides sp.]
MISRHLLSLAAALVLAAGSATATSVADSIRARMEAAPLHRVEGLWQFPADGGVVAIEREPDGSEAYRMIVIEASNRLIEPGTVIGRLRPTVKRDVFEARMMTGFDTAADTLTSPRIVTMTLADSDSRLMLRHHRKGLKLHWWTLLPYMFRRFVTEVDETPRDLGGCRRIYPEPAVPANPRYL